MSAPPYMKLFWADYHQDTRHLSRSEHGAYFLLIGEAWNRTGVLPDDDALLARWALATPQEWAELKPIVMGFFKLSRRGWTHKRISAELASYADVSRKRKVAGKKGGSTSRGKDIEIPEASAEANARQMPAKPEPEPEPEISSEPKGSSLFPEMIPPESAKARVKTKRCPADYVPSQAALKIAEAEGFSAGEIERELAKFKDHQFRDAHRDWDAVLRNWFRNAADRRPRPRVIENGHSHDPSPKRQRHEANMAAALAGAELASDVRE